MSSAPAPWYQYCPILDLTGMAKDGDAIFYKDGTVILRDQAFIWSRPIDFEFSGCKAERGKSGVLTITTPVGTVYRYKYLKSAEMWYRMVESEVETSLIALWKAEAIECQEQYGLVIGGIYFVLLFLIYKVALVFVYVHFCVLVLATITTAPIVEVLEDSHAGQSYVAIAYLIPVLLTWVGHTVYLVCQYSWAHHRTGFSGWLWAAWWSFLFLWPIALSGAVVAALVIVCVFVSPQ